jgi:hypothetical protein
MRVTLVQPPSGLYDTGDLAPPLGLLTIAAVLESDGMHVSIVDMNVRGITDHDWVEVDFHEHALVSILATNPDVVGFTSMALESHVCLEMARQVKAVDPKIVIVLGGPHFSAISKDVLEFYPWVDYVIAGEGELAILNLLRRLQGKAAPGGLTNVALRTGRDIQLNREFKPLQTLEALPFPAYHLVNLPLYFSTNPMRLLDYEHGRGCIFKCSFCYSPAHWGQGSQVKQAQRILDEVFRLGGLGAQHLFFVQDNFPNSMAVANTICDALAEARTGLTWNCYATLPHLVPDLLDRLAAAGCTSVFVGVDAVSSDSKSAFAKHFFKGWEALAQKLDACLTRGIVPTCAFMVDPPVSSAANTDSVLNVALFARMMGCGIRLNTLTLYNQSATAADLSGSSRTYTNLKPLLLLDTPRIMHENSYARERPGLFPFHHTHLPLPLYRKFVTGMHVDYTLFTSFPRTLTQYVLVDNGSLWALLESIAEKIDLSAVHAVMRRPMERELFVREFSRRRLSRQTHGAFELEMAEYQLGRNEPAASITIRSGGRPMTYQKGRFELVDLPYHPAAYDQIARLSPIRDRSKTYLLVRRGDQIEYFHISKHVVSTLNQINNTPGTGQTLELPPALVEEFTRAGALQTPLIN